MYSMQMKEKLEEQIGECLGLERAAQQAVEDIASKGLLDKPGVKSKIMWMRQEAGSHEDRLEQIIGKVIDSEGLDKSNIDSSADETVRKVTEIMKTYLGEDPDTLDA